MVRYHISKTHDGEYPYNVQQFKEVQGQWIYSGFGRFVKSMVDAVDYISTNMVSRMKKSQYALTGRRNDGDYWIATAQSENEVTHILNNDIYPDPTIKDVCIFRWEEKIDIRDISYEQNEERSI